MRTMATMLIPLLLTSAVMAGEQTAKQIIFDFDAVEVGKLLAGFSIALTGGGGPVAWVIQEDPTAPSRGKVLAQTSTDETSTRFPLCIYDGFTARDVEVSVKFKPVSGKVDQAAGIVWRYHDANNYYIVRANALENNVVLYKVENGKRTDLKPIGAGLFAYGKKVQVPSGQWNELRLVATGNRFEVSLNGEQLFSVEDNTFPDTGKVGLWTKADSVTLFDDLQIQGLDA